LTYRGVLRSAERQLARVDITDSLLEAEVLIGHASGLTRTELLARLSDTAPEYVVKRTDQLIARRLTREPLAYIVGHREFYGREFIVTPDVLIPRPETELLVGRALELLRDVEGPLVVDVGTGSGAIGLSILAEKQSARLLATDISEKAIAVALLNARRLGLRERVDFVVSNLLDAVSRQADVTVLVTANLPYVPVGRAQSLAPEVRCFEPPVALFSGEDGLSLISSLLTSLDRFLQPGEYALLEIDEGQAERLSGLVQTVLQNYAALFERDLMNQERLLQLIKRIDI
jgi:release factor glutamine methyltransferase